MTGLRKPIIISLLIFVGIIVIAMDAIVAAGLAFTSVSHYSIELLLLLSVACCLDLPASIIGMWQPQFGAILVGCGIFGTLLYAAVYFMQIHQLPTLKVTLQGVLFLAPKLALCGLMYLISQKEKPELRSA